MGWGESHAPQQKPSKGSSKYIIFFLCHQPGGVSIRMCSHDKWEQASQPTSSYDSKAQYSFFPAARLACLCWPMVSVLSSCISRLLLCRVLHLQVLHIQTRPRLCNAARRGSCCCDVNIWETWVQRSLPHFVRGKKYTKMPLRSNRD
jgi:hypothetical protein